jgi:hypothetical protein
MIDSDKPGDQLRIGPVGSAVPDRIREIGLSSGNFNEVEVATALELFSRELA